MNTPTNTIKYFAYVRKSTEGEERQALSIESQKDKVKELFPNLEIVGTLEERHSAFKPYNRPSFEEMIRRIKSGEAGGIIAWHPDRLSRNEIDASTITYLVRTGIIKDLKFASYNFDNSPEGIMMLQLALSQSQYFSSKLGKDVRRGLEKKVSLGWLPGLAPEGYLNDLRLEKGQRTLITDKKRSPVLRKAFDMMLTGAYSAQQVLDIVNNEWGYTTRKKHKLGGGSLTRSVWYKMLTNPFYAGVITYNGKESPGKHKPLITLDEFNRIQEVLGLRGCKRKPKIYDFTFGGMFKCGHCGCSITAEHKSKYIKCDKEVREYNYYHCTYRKKDVPCKERCVEEEEINKEVVGTLKKLEMHPVFLDWALEYLDGQKAIEQTKDKRIEVDTGSKIEALEKQISGLTLMRAKNLLDDDEYSKEKATIKSEIEKLSKPPTKEKSNDEIIDLTKEKFVYSFHALKRFVEGNNNTKREVLADLGSNRQIKDKKTLITVNKWLLPILENAELHNQKLARFEPIVFGSDKRKDEALNMLRLSWLGGRGSNPRPRD